MLLSVKRYRCLDLAIYTDLLTLMAILLNIARSKGNQTIKFCQLECNMRKAFLKNQTRNVVEKLVPDPSFSEK